MKIIKIALILIILFTIIIVPGLAKADEGYDILSHDIYLKIAENGELQAKETIVLDYVQKRHGFYYNLLYAADVTYEDEDGIHEVSYKHNIDDFHVANHKYKTSKEEYNGNLYLVTKIGDPDSYVFGEQRYRIGYTSTVGYINNDQSDQLYRNLFFCEDGETIDKVSFTIDMPKDFDESQVYFYLGEYGASDSEAVIWQKDGTRIRGNLDRPMNSGEILTVQIILEEGYFVDLSDPMVTWEIIIIAIIIFFALLTFLLWLRHGQDGKVYPSVEFYAPDGMTPAEVGYIFYGMTEHKDVLSLLMFWADKGYLSIKELPEDDLEFTKISDLPKDAKKFEHIMFDDLFKDGDIVQLSSLKKSFYTTIKATKEAIHDHFRSNPQNNVFTPASMDTNAILFFFQIFPILAALILLFVYSNSGFIVIIITTLVIFCLITCLEMILARWEKTKPKTRTISLWIFIVLLLIAFLLFISIVPGLMNASSYDMSTLITSLACISTIIMIFFTSIMYQRTRQGNEWYGRLIGFKRFIKKAEKERIIRLVEENPSYFYSVLPYAYVLGVTDKWAKHLDEIGFRAKPPK